MERKSWNWNSKECQLVFCSQKGTLPRFSVKPYSRQFSRDNVDDTKTSCKSTWTEMKKWSSQLWLRFKQSQGKLLKCFRSFNGIRTHGFCVSAVVHSYVRSSHNIHISTWTTITSRLLQLKVTWFCLRNTISGSSLKQNNSALVFQTLTIRLKWESPFLVTWPRLDFENYELPLSHTNFALKL